MIDMKEACAQTAVTIINKMFKSSFFDICAVDRASQLLGVAEKSEAYVKLRPLHCINWTDMAPGLADEVKRLTVAHLTVQPDYFDMNFSPINSTAKEVKPPRKLLPFFC